MANVTLEQLRERYEAVEARRRHYEWKSEQPGRLRLHEMWRHAYLAHPYLLGAPDDRIADRFCDLFKNAMELSPRGQITPVPLSETDEFMQVFTHMLEEYISRGGQAPDEVIARARSPLVKYFERKTPIGVRLFERYKVPDGPIVVKYGKREHLEPMFLNGELRIANAKFYNNSQHLDSVRDDEQVERSLFLPIESDWQGNRIALFKVIKLYMKMMISFCL